MINPTAENLLASLLQVDEKNSNWPKLQGKATDQDSKNLTVRLNAEHLYKTMIPLFLSNLFKVVKIEMPGHLSSQVINLEAVANTVIDVITVKGAIQLLQEKPEEMKGKFHDQRSNSNFISRFQEVISACSEFLEVAGQIETE